MPGWLVGMSIFATFVSSISFLGLPGKAYQSDWNAFVFSLSIPVASIVAARFFVPLYRSVNSVSAYKYLEIRFGYWARAYASICYLLTQIIRTGAILYLLALPLNAMLGWDIGRIIIITGISVILYSMLGGISAVIWTDAVQGFILIAGAGLRLDIDFFHARRSRTVIQHGDGASQVQPGRFRPEPGRFDVLGGVCVRDFH